MNNGSNYHYYGQILGLKKSRNKATAQGHGFRYALCELN